MFLIFSLSCVTLFLHHTYAAAHQTDMFEALVTDSTPNWRVSVFDKASILPPGKPHSPGLVYRISCVLYCASVAPDNTQPPFRMVKEQYQSNSTFHHSQLMLYFGSAAVRVQTGLLEPRQMVVMESLLTVQKGRADLLLLKMNWKFKKWDKEQRQLTCVSTGGDGLCKQTSNDDSSS